MSTHVTAPRQAGRKSKPGTSPFRSTTQREAEVTSGDEWFWAPAGVSRCLQRKRITGVSVCPHGRNTWQWSAWYLWDELSAAFAMLEHSQQAEAWWSGGTLRCHGRSENMDARPHAALGPIGENARHVDKPLKGKTPSSSSTLCRWQMLLTNACMKIRIFRLPTFSDQQGRWTSLYFLRCCGLVSSISCAALVYHV